jgi:hypothetical protein
METTAETTTEKLYDGKTFEEKIQSLSPMYAVVCVNPDGTLSGLVEHSFSMDKSAERVNVFWTSEKRGIDGKKWATDNSNKANGWFVIELTAEDCPIEVDWLTWLNATYKFTQRNAPFKIREGFDFSEQAKEATIRENYKQKHDAIMEFVSVQNKAEERYNQKIRAAQEIMEAETAEIKPEIQKLRNKYQAKAKQIAIAKGICPKLPDGRYMNTGNSRITQYGVQLKWTSAGLITYTVPWKELF